MIWTSSGCRRLARVRWQRLILSLIIAWLFTGAIPAQAAAPQAPKAPHRSLLPQIASNHCNAIKSPTIFGVQTYGHSSRSSPYFSLLQRSGATWVREPIEWSAVEPNNVPASQYAWGAVDHALSGAKDGCFNLIATVGGAPSWAASGPRSPIYPEKLGEFRQFVGALVERYDGDGIADGPDGIVVNYWEFYNEPDYSQQPDGPGWGNYGAEYAVMLATVYDTVKNANPKAQVVFGGIAYDLFLGEDPGGSFIRTFLRDVLATEINGQPAGDFFDIMNFHYYPAFRAKWTDDNSTGLVGKTNAIREELAAFGLTKPIIITEGGWHSSPNDILYGSDELQSRYVVQLYAQSLALDLDFMIWWTFYDLPSDEYPYAYGLVTDASPPATKPSYSVYQTVVQRLHRATYAGQLGVAQTNDVNLEVYHFTAKDGKTFYVAWLNPTHTNESKELSLAAETATVYAKDNSLVGVVQDNGDGANDGKVKVQVGGSPIYIVVN
jgi:hypothetical protein